MSTKYNHITQTRQSAASSKEAAGIVLRWLGIGDAPLRAFEVIRGFIAR